MLIALKYVADHRETFLENFVAQGERMVERGQDDGAVRVRDSARPASRGRSGRPGEPVPRSTGDGDPRRDVRLHAETLRRPSTVARPTRLRAAAVRRPRRCRSTPATGSCAWTSRTRRRVRTLLAIQHFKAGRSVAVRRHRLDARRAASRADAARSPTRAVLTKPMHAARRRDATVAGTVAGNGHRAPRPHLGDWRSAVLPWKVGARKVSVADTRVHRRRRDAIRPARSSSTNADAAARDAVTQLGLDGVGRASAVPSVRSHVDARSRASRSCTTWIETQNEGWVRYALRPDGRAVHLHGRPVAQASPALLDEFDVVVLPARERRGDDDRERPADGRPADSVEEDAR